MDTYPAIVAVTLVLLLAEQSGALQCFQCSGSGPDSPCETDVDTLTATREDGGGMYSKNCSIENQHLCFIEYSHNRGKMSTFIRDCSDGLTFDFANKIARLLTIYPHNQTTCATYETSGTIVCISVCRTNFCNGPQSSGTVNAAEGRSIWCDVFTFVMAIMTNVALLAQAP